MSHRDLLTWMRIVITTGVCLLSVCQAIAQDRQIRRAAGSSESVGAEARTALVIGNGAYASDPLANPVNDAKAVAAALRELGFDVSEKVNATEKEMLRSIDDFGQKLRTGGIGLFYYSGHGLQANGNNYMVPIGANIQAEPDIEYETVNVGRVLAKMEAAENRVNIVILDACRNNPYKRSFRSPSQGLAPMNAPSGTLIAYATSPGTVATDGPGMKNSPFTAELLKQLLMTGVKVEEVFKRVGAGVQQATGKKQIPWYLSSVVGDFYFKPGVGVPVQSGGTSGTQLAGGQAVIERPQPEPQQPAPRTGSLKVDSNPPGAAVYVDGQARGKTPVNVTGLAVGNVSVRVVLEGYKSQERTTEIRSGKEVQANFLLDREEKQAAQKPGQTWREPITGMEFVWVPGGCYQMGCGSWTNDCGNDERPVHEVCLDGFWLGKTEVTQGQWRKVMGNNPSYNKNGDDYPVEFVSWNEAKNFIRKLNEVSKAANRFGLPTEAEWEYACRSGGKAEEYAGGKGVDKVAWYGAKGGWETLTVASKAANGLGFYDMSGNVREWCEDIYSDGAYGKHQRSNPLHTEKDFGAGSLRVLRGGCFRDLPSHVRCAFRRDAFPSTCDNYTGLRLVMNP